MLWVAETTRRMTRSSIASLFFVGRFQQLLTTQPRSVLFPSCLSLSLSLALGSLAAWNGALQHHLAKKSHVCWSMVVVTSFVVQSLSSVLIQKIQKSKKKIQKIG